MLKKIGEDLGFKLTDILPAKIALADDAITKRFIKLAKKLKKVAPKADDFIYFSAIMMHAAEAALINQDTGEPILNKSGQPVQGTFENFKLGNGTESVRWVSPDGIMPYRNLNRDIFGSTSLIEAHKKWVGKPLCRDHVSDSVDGIRGIIIDTYYDNKFKRVHALCALDRKNYADLARKVETGYSNSVSMGTGVGRSICFECGNPAMVEADYCACIKARSHYGEINLDLSPIELSLVVNGADALAKVRTIVASMNEYASKKQARLEELQQSSCVNPAELKSLAASLQEMQTKISSLMQIEKAAAPEQAPNISVDTGRLVALLNRIDKERDPEIRKLLEGRVDVIRAQLQTPEEPPAPAEEPAQPARATTGGGHEYTSPEWIGNAGEIGLSPANRLSSRKVKKKEGGIQGAISNDISLLRSKIDTMENVLNKLKTDVEDNHMNSARLKARAKARRAYWLGGGGVNEPTPGKEKYPKEDADKIRDTEDKQMVGEPLETGSDGLHPGDLEVKQKLLRAKELEDRRLKRRAYFQGGGGLNEPTPGKEKYPKEEADKIRDNEDKHMTGTGDMGGTDGMFPGDEATKKKLLRAALRARFTKVADRNGNLIKEASRWDIYAGDKLILTATGSEIYADQLEASWDFLKSADYGKSVIKHIRDEGFDKTAYLLKGAADPLAELDPAAIPADPALEAPVALEAPEAPLAVEAPAGDVSVSQEQGETQKAVEAALGNMEEKIAEIRDLVTGMDSDELVDIDVTVEPKADAAPAVEAPGALDEVLSASKEDVMKVEALMDSVADELAEASETLGNLDTIAAANHPMILKAVLAAVEDSEFVIASADRILEAAKKDDDKDDDDKKDKEDKKDDDKDEKDDKDEDKKDKDDKKDEKEAKAQKLLDDALRVRAENRANLLARAYEADMLDTPADPESAQCACGPEGHEQDCMAAADGETLGDLANEMKSLEDDAQSLLQSADDDEMYVDEAPETVLAARKSERDALVAQAGDIVGKYELTLGKADNATEPKYFEAHPGGKGTVTELTHTKTPEAKVETISEIHDAMRDVAESGPRNVREAAAQLHEQIVKGAMKAEDVDSLVAEGKVDAAAASYWKQFFSQAPDASSFGADLSKEFAGKKKEASQKEYQAKLRRAYDVGMDAQEKGLVSLTRTALDSYVDELMKFDDAAFESTKRVVAAYSSTKRSGGSVPRVGVDAETKAMEVTASVDAPAPSSALDMLSNLNWK